MSVVFQPVFPWAVLLPGAVVLLALTGWLAWRGAATAPGKRPWLLGARLAGLGLILALLSNPGRWESEGEAEPPGWALLVDRSASMAVEDASSGALPRLRAAVEFADRLKGASRSPAAISQRTFAEALAGWPADTKSLLADGKASLLGKAGQTLVDEAAESGVRWTGIVVLSDGRQTGTEADLDLFATRARALGMPVHTLTFGGAVARKDLVLTLPRRQIMAYADQKAVVPVVVENQGLGPLRLELQLLDAGGKEVARLPLTLEKGAKVESSFQLPAGSPEGSYRVELPLMPGDENPSNNSGGFHLRILKSRTRVFVAEGAPYWDTKFLAQLLREQGMMEVEAVYRLQPGRFYRVVSGKNGGLEETQDTFPDTAAALNQYDLVVLGKGADAFLTPQRLENLRAFVRDQGGSLLFSRGRPSAGPLEGLEPLEPGRWGEDTGATHTLIPTPDGEESGLFGERLPHGTSTLWRGLPPLTDVRSLAELRPFTRVLASGERAGGGGKVPVLVARRFGRGMVTAVNGDGLWRWSFTPSAKKPGEDWHREFWLQLLQWTSTYSEFMPGEDFSLRLSSSSIHQGAAVRAIIGYRGKEAPGTPMLEVAEPGVPVRRIPAALAGEGEDGRPYWSVVLVPKQAGQTTLRLYAAERAGPAAALMVMPPPAESDELSADPEALARVATQSGGAVWKPEQWQELLKKLEPEAQAVPLAEARWRPLWNKPWILLVAAALLAGEWIFRRRLGML